MKKTDFLVIGCGIVGLNIAIELKKRFPDQKIDILEKEAACGEHGSGRNSGVLHAGFYYTSDSLKARFTRQGNDALTAYCDEKSLAINKCGKLVVAQSEKDHPLLDELLKRGRDNGVPLQEISEAEAKEIEPKVKTCGRAIFSPITSSVDPLEVMNSLEKDARDMGIRIHYGTAYKGVSGRVVKTAQGDFEFGYLVNAGGLYADKIARGFGFSKNHSILPFKGLYLYGQYLPNAIKTHIYPVPDLNYPFLGVHYTVKVDGSLKIGPTAMPVLWRENYKGFKNFKMNEFFEIAGRNLALMFFANFDYKHLARVELQKQFRSKMVSLGSSLLEGVTRDKFKKWGKPGIRAQLINIKTWKLEMDFVLEGDARSMHVLNAVSPGFTCSMPFASHVCDQIEARV